MTHVTVHVLAARRPLRSPNAKGGRARNVVAQDYTHARYIAPERRGTQGETERKGGWEGGKKREEEAGRHARGGGLPRGIRITSGCRNYCARGPRPSRKWDRLFRVGGNGR